MSRRNNRRQRTVLPLESPIRKSDTSVAPPSDKHELAGRASNRWVTRWRGLHSYLILAALTLACLAPFCGKAIHIDDPCFLWSAQQIVKHPLDPFGFPVVWDTTSRPMFAVTTNPPLVSYYLALIGQALGWSEVALHLAFLLPALVVVLGTYRLAGRFTRSPLIAAAATLLTPALLVSSTNLMCDTAMLAAWILAVIFWLEGIDRESWVLLGISSLLIAACALTKYFGMALIPLLAAYAITRTRRSGKWIAFLVIPVLILAGYQHWTHLLYGTGLLSQAASDAYDQRLASVSPLAKTIIGLSFTGGCVLPALTFIPLLWSRRAVLGVALIAGVAAVCCANGTILLPTMRLADKWNQVSVQLGFFVMGGIAVLALAFSDWWKRRDADSTFLSLWLLGTFFFASFVNWAVNARSILPMIPAAGILLARRIDRKGPFLNSSGWPKLMAPLVVAGLVSIWITAADTKWADSAKLSAQYIRDHVGNPQQVAFEGHWGFQYYMQKLGFLPVDINTYEVQEGNVVVIPENSTSAQPLPQQLIAAQSIQEFDVNLGVTTNSTRLGAGFYADAFGPLPYAFGSVPPERYLFDRLTLGEEK